MERLPAYSQFKLIEPFDLLVSEYERLSGERGFTNNNEKQAKEIESQARLQGMICAYYQLKTGYKRNRAIEYLKYWGVQLENYDVASYKMIESRIRQEETNLRISKKRNNAKKRTSKRISFEKNLSELSYSLNGKSYDPYKLTLAQYIADIQLSREVNKHKENGRTKRK